jgi:hydroxypyruvate isomerase
VPGRNEIDESQELYYPAIMEAILEAGFEGYVAQEFIPKDKTKKGLKSLADAVRRCDV